MFSRVVVVYVAFSISGCGNNDPTRHIADAPTGCTTVDCEAVAAVFTGLSWQLPCGSVIDMYDCAAVEASSTGMVTGGTPGATYDVTLHFQGVVEQKTYAGGTTNAYWNIGGAPSTSDGYNIYSLAISAPAQTFYLNAGMSSIGHTWPIDYVETVSVMDGATLTLTANPLDGAQILNIDADFQPVTAPGATLVTQPYNGQFIQMDVTSIGSGQ
jgi:hypothetical protein